MPISVFSEDAAAAINTGLIGIFISLEPIWSEYDEVSARSHLFKPIVVIAVIIMGSLASSKGLLSLPGPHKAQPCVTAQFS